MILPAFTEQHRTAKSACITFSAAPSLHYFSGHFPGFPVLPGVVQVGWAREFADRLFGGRHTITGMRRIKFVRLITPEQPVTLELDRTTDRITFQYFDSQGSFSSGTLDMEWTA